MVIVFLHLGSHFKKHWLHYWWPCCRPVPASTQWNLYTHSHCCGYRRYRCRPRDRLRVSKPGTFSDADKYGYMYSQLSHCVIYISCHWLWRELLHALNRQIDLSSTYSLKLASEMTLWCSLLIWGAPRQKMWRWSSRVFFRWRNPHQNRTMYLLWYLWIGMDILLLDLGRH
jgi:hypothetical protein